MGDWKVIRPVCEEFVKEHSKRVTEWSSPSPEPDIIHKYASSLIKLELFC